MPSNWISDIAWDGDRPYRTFLMDGPGYKAGQKTYVSPAEIHPENTTDPRLLQWAQANQPQRGGFVNSGGTWDRDSGEFEGGTNWGNLAALGIGGAIAAPFVAPALAALGGGGISGGGAAGASVPAGSAAGGLIPTAAVPSSSFALGAPGLAGAGGVAGGGGVGGGGGMGLGSILSWLGKGSDALDAVGRVGGQLTGAAQGSADQRMRESDQLLRQGLLRQQQANDAFSNNLRGAEFNRGEQDRQRKAAILSALLSGTQDQAITPGNPLIASRMPQVTGGARPSNLTGNKDALMQLLSQSGPSAPTYQGAEIPDVKQGGMGENILGGAGLITSILGALGKPKAQTGAPQRAY